MLHNIDSGVSLKTLFLVLLTASGLHLYSPAQVQAMNHVDRCNGDPGYPSQAKRRVAWALKCGLIGQRLAEMYNELDQYPTLEIPGRPMYLWFDKHAPCYQGARIVGSCAAVGCFAQNTQLLFPQGYKTLKESEGDGVEFIMSLSDGLDFPRSWAFSPTEIQFYMSGQTNETLVEISTHGSSIQVTKNHPMVLANGEVVSAEDLNPGLSTLATIDGPQEIISLKSVDYDDEVWNVYVQSKRKRANIHVAEGFLTGGLRYQNEWTDTFSRRLERLSENLDSER